MKKSHRVLRILCGVTLMSAPVLLIGCGADPRAASVETFSRILADAAPGETEVCHPPLRWEAWDSRQAQARGEYLVAKGWARRVERHVPSPFGRQETEVVFEPTADECVRVATTRYGTVVRFSEPAEAFGSVVSEVTYTLEIEWERWTQEARAQEIFDFPQLEGEHQVLLRQTNDGWEAPPGWSG